MPPDSAPKQVVGPSVGNSSNAGVSIAGTYADPTIVKVGNKIANAPVLDVRDRVLTGISVTTRRDGARCSLLAISLSYSDGSGAHYGRSETAAANSTQGSTGTTQTRVQGVNRNIYVRSYGFAPGERITDMTIWPIGKITFHTTQYTPNFLVVTTGSMNGSPVPAPVQQPMARSLLNLDMPKGQFSSFTDDMDKVVFNRDAGISISVGSGLICGASIGHNSDAKTGFITALGFAFVRPFISAELRVTDWPGLSDIRVTDDEPEELACMMFHNPTRDSSKLSAPVSNSKTFTVARSWSLPSQLDVIGIGTDSSVSFTVVSSVPVLAQQQETPGQAPTWTWSVDSKPRTVPYAMESSVDKSFSLSVSAPPRTTVIGTALINRDVLTTRFLGRMYLMLDFSLPPAVGPDGKATFDTFSFAVWGTYESITLRDPYYVEKVQAAPPAAGAELAPPPTPPLQLPPPVTADH